MPIVWLGTIDDIGIMTIDVNPTHEVQFWPVEQPCGHDVMMCCHVAALPVGWSGEELWAWLAQGLVPVMGEQWVTWGWSPMSDCEVCSEC